MKFGDFIERLCYSDKFIIQIWLYDGDLSNPIAMFQPEWKATKIFSDRNISSIRFKEMNGWVLDLMIILEE